MRHCWLMLFVLPIALFGKQEERGFFFTVPMDEEVLLNLAQDESEDLDYPFGAINSEDFDSQGLSLMEIDERDDSLKLWSEERFASEEKTPLSEKKASTRNFEETFNVDNPFSNCSENYKPALENVPESNSRLIQVSGPKPKN